MVTASANMRHSSQHPMVYGNGDVHTNCHNWCRDHYPRFMFLPAVCFAIHYYTTHPYTSQHSVHTSFTGQGSYHILVPSVDTVELTSASDVVEEHAPQSHSSALSKNTSVHDFESAQRPHPQVPNSSTITTAFKQSSITLISFRPSSPESY